MNGGCFHTLSINQFLQGLEGLHPRVARGHGRIEITVDGCDDVCVLVSKAELEGLERALEILAGTQEFAAMSQTLADLVRQEQPAPIV